MSNLISNNQRETLQERLAKRRLLRNKKFLDKNSIDESEITLINHSPIKTQSLDRKSSNRTIQNFSLSSPSTITTITSTYQRKSSPSIIKNQELLPSENLHSKQNYFTHNNKTNSTPLLQQITKNHSFESDNEKAISSQSLFTNEQQQQQQNSSYHDKKSAIIKKTISPILPPITSTITEKSNPVQESIRKHPISNQINNQFQSSSEHPLSHPQSSTNTQQNYFNFPSFDSKPIARSTSEQIVSKNKFKHQPINSPFVKQNSLALSYLFNKQIINSELAGLSSSNNKNSQQKTVWD